MKSKQIPVKFITSSTISLLLIVIIFFSKVIESHEQLVSTIFTKMKVNLSIEDLSVGESPTGLIIVEGIVYNNSTKNLGDVKVKVELLDANSNLITETIRFVTPPSSIFKPGYSEQFNFLITANNIDHYNITAFGDEVQ